MTTWIDFKTIKSQISMEMLLTHYGLKLRRVSRDQFRGACPLPSHSSDKSRESFNVNLSKNVWACQSGSCVSARGGRKGGNVLDFVAVMEGLSIREAGLKLQEWFSLEATPVTAKEGKKELVREKEEPEPTEAGESQPEVSNPCLKFTLKGVNSSHPYLAERGISKETAEHFGVGFFPGKGSMAGRVVIPIHNEKGELVAYAGRAIDGAEPKYKLPAGFEKSLVLYNLHRVPESKDRGVVVVEGFFDAIKVHQAGFPNVMALMGSSLSEAQEKLIVENFQKVILMLDGDDAGVSAGKEIAGRLVRKVFTQIVEVSAGKQPDQLSSDEIAALLSVVS